MMINYVYWLGEEEREREREEKAKKKKKTEKPPRRRRDPRTFGRSAVPDVYLPRAPI